MITAVLVINRTDSRCSHCGSGCLPMETHHFSRTGYTHTGAPGCGAEFVALDSDYIGMKNSVTLMRPDLPWVGIDESRLHD